MSPEEKIILENEIIRRVVAILLPVLHLNPAIQLPEIPKESETEKKEKSAIELASYARYVFADASEEERSMAESVIRNFMKKYESTKPNEKRG